MLSKAQKLNLPGRRVRRLGNNCPSIYGFSKRLKRKINGCSSCRKKYGLKEKKPLSKKLKNSKSVLFTRLARNWILPNLNSTIGTRSASGSKIGNKRVLHLGPKPLGAFMRQNALRANDL